MDSYLPLDLIKTKVLVTNTNIQYDAIPSW